MERIPAPEDLDPIEELPLAERAERLEELERELRAALDDADRP